MAAVNQIHELAGHLETIFPGSEGKAPVACIIEIVLTLRKNPFIKGASMLLTTLWKEYHQNMTWHFLRAWVTRLYVTVPWRSCEPLAGSPRGVLTLRAGMEPESFISGCVDVAG